MKAYSSSIRYHEYEVLCFKSAMQYDYNVNKVLYFHEIKCINVEIVIIGVTYQLISSQFYHLLLSTLEISDYSQQLCISNFNSIDSYWFILFPLVRGHEEATFKCIIIKI